MPSKRGRAFGGIIKWRGSDWLYKALVFMAGIWFGGLILFAFYEGHASHDGPRLYVPEPPRPTVITLQPGKPESPLLNKIWRQIIPKQQETSVLISEQSKGNFSIEPTALPDAPGELGRAVNVEKSKLSADEQKKFQEGWDHNSFNEYISNMISVRRRLSDVRDEEYVKKIFLSIIYHSLFK